MNDARRNDSEKQPNGTRIVLPLSPEIEVHELSSRMTEDLQPRLLLFLRNLSRMILNHSRRYKVVMNKRVLFADNSTLLQLEVLHRSLKNIVPTRHILNLIAISLIFTLQNHQLPRLLL